MDYMVRLPGAAKAALAHRSPYSIQRTALPGAGAAARMPISATVLHMSQSRDTVVAVLIKAR
jgi:hypothetical protein